MSRDITYCAYGDKCKNNLCIRKKKEYKYFENEHSSMAYYDDCEFKPEEYKPKKEKENV